MGIESRSAAGRMTRRRLAPLALGLLLPLLPTAARAELTFMVTPWAGFVSGGSFQNSANNDVLYVNDSAGFGFILDLLDTPRAYYELLYSFQRTDLGGIDTPGWPSNLDLDIHYLQIGGMYEYPRERMRPYIAGGIGLTAIVPDGQDSSTNLSFSLGGGVQIPLSARLALRIEGRGLLTVISDNTEIFCASSGAGGGCAVGVEGDSLAQIEVLAGLSFGL